MNAIQKITDIEHEQPSFELFWSMYPKKVDKLDAIKAWGQVTKGKGRFTPDEIIAGLRRNLPDMLRKDRQYVKYPAGWLRKGGWMDEPAPLTAPTGKRSILDAAMDRLRAMDEGIH